MALSKGTWVGKSANGRTVFSCRVEMTGTLTSQTDFMTNPTPVGLDTTKPYTIIVKPAEDLTAAGSSAVDIWGCLNGDASLAAGDVGTDCFIVHSNSTDIDAGTTETILVFPNAGIAQVTNAALGIAVIPSFPHLIINVDMTADAEDAAYVDFYVVQ